MRRTGLLSASLFVFALSGCEDLRDSAARVEVQLTDFRAGCVQLVVSDAEDAQRSQTLTLAPPTGRTQSWVVAVYRGSGWSRSLVVRAEAREQSCTGGVVDTRSAEVQLTRNEVVPLTLALTATDADLDGFAATSSGGSDCDDGAADIRPGAPERCDGIDQNCDQTADEGLGVGALCAGDDTCPGLQACAPDGGIQCAVPAVNLYFADVDGDLYGDGDAERPSTCGAWGPDAGMAATGDDCDDTRAYVYPGAPERCDGLDNACDGATDEPFFVGQACTPTNGDCTGVRVCAADGGSFCQSDGPPQSVYLDDDYDGHGAGAPVGTTCEGPDAGTSLSADDCNDANSGVSPSAAEVCDYLDNDCDQSNDEGGVCTQLAQFYDRSSGGANHDWLTVAAWRDGGTGVFIAGAGDRIRAAAPGGAISDRNGDCVNVNWEGVWVDPRTSLGYLAGRGAHLAVHPAYADTCTVTDAGTALEPLSSLHGYERPDGVLLFAVAENGRSVVWDGGTAARELPAVSPPVCFEDVHGLGPELQFAVGGTSCTAAASTPVIYRWDPSGEVWTPQALPAGFGTGKLLSVFVVNPHLAYAVGTVTGDGSGAALMAVWDGTAWSAHSTPSGSHLLTGVVGTGRDSLMVTGDRSVWAYTQNTWIQATSDPDPLWDLAASRSDDVWVVGDNGTLLHWPN